MTLQFRKFPLEFRGEMPAGKDARAGARTHWALPKLFHFRMLRRVVEVATEGRGEEVLVAGRVGDDVVAPVVEHAPVRIGETVGDVALEFIRARFVAVDATVNVAHRPRCGLDLRAMKNAVAQIRRAAGIEHH